MVRPVYLLPYYTEDVDKACTSFEVIWYGDEGYDHRFKIPTNLESSECPCLISVCDKDIQNKVSHILLARADGAGQMTTIRKRFGAAGSTSDILGSVSSYQLFLMWK